MRNFKKRKKILFVQKILIFLAISSCIIIIIEIIYFTSVLQKPKFISPIATTYQNVLAAITQHSPKNQLIELLHKHAISYASINSYGDGSLVVKLKNDEEVLLSSKKSLAVQVSSLQLILSRLTIEGKRIAKLDLRFDNPVIVFATSQ